MPLQVRRGLAADRTFIGAAGEPLLDTDTNQLHFGDGSTAGGNPAIAVPTDHAASHAAAGSDPITIAQSQVSNLATDLAGKAPVSHTHALSDLTQSGATNGQVATWNQSLGQWQPQTHSGGGGGGGFSIIRQVYTASTSGIAIPNGATYLRVIAWGGAGGGGGGQLNVAGQNRTGGSGGGGGSMNETIWRVADLSGTLTVVVGAGGAGGSGATTNGAAPSNGGSGGTSTVHATWKGTLTRIGWGANGINGAATALGTYHSGGPGGSQGYAGGTGGNGANSGGGLGSQTSSISVGLSRTGHGGGGGGGCNTSNQQYTGGGSFGSYVTGESNINGGSVGGGHGETPITRGTDWEYSRAGGGGGGGNTGGSGGNGGNGDYSAGGGGGGGGTNMGTGETGGNGGAGGQGLVVMYWS